MICNPQWCKQLIKDISNPETKDECVARNNVWLTRGLKRCSFVLIVNTKTKRTKFGKLWINKFIKTNCSISSSFSLPSSHSLFQFITGLLVVFYALNFVASRHSRVIKEFPLGQIFSTHKISMNSFRYLKDIFSISVKQPTYLHIHCKYILIYFISY